MEKIILRLISNKHLLCIIQEYLREKNMLFQIELMMITRNIYNASMSIKFYQNKYGYYFLTKHNHKFLLRKYEYNERALLRRLVNDWYITDSKGTPFV